MNSRRSVSRPPTQGEIGRNKAFIISCYAFGITIILLVFFIVFSIASEALPSIREHGFSFFTGRQLVNDNGNYGILPAIWGTLYSSILALILGTVFGLAVAIFLSENMLASFVFRILHKLGLAYHPVWGRLPENLELFLKNLVELLAAIPSVVYGLWGYLVLIPLIKPACNWMYGNFGEVWGLSLLFGKPLQGQGLLPAAIVLAIMILPTISALSRDAMATVPPKLREAAYGLGATRWETIFSVTIPTAFTGIVGGIILAFGRALGETMALAMLVGSSNTVELSLFGPANTLAALLANSFPEATEPGKIASLMYAALVLLGITLLVNIIGELIMLRSRIAYKEHR